MKVAVYFGTGYEEIEALSVVDVLRRGKVEVLMVGVNGKTVVSGRGISINMDAVIEEVDHSLIDMMVLPGGIPGVNHLEASTLLIEQLKKFKKQNKWIAAICAAPSVLGKAGLLEGEKGTCYPGYEETLIGCKYINQGVVQSGKMITGKGAGYSLAFALELLKVLKGEEIARQVQEAMLIGEKMN